MTIEGISTNYIDLACECEGIIADLEEIRRKVVKFKGNFKYDSDIVTIIDSYVTPYILGLMGEGQIMMSLADVLKRLDEEAVDTYVDVLLDEEDISDVEEVSHV